MNKRSLTMGLAAAAGLALAAPAVAAPTHAGPPDRVWVCHFEDHVAADPWVGGNEGENYDGDYTLSVQPVEGEEPTEKQRDWCLNLKGGEDLILLPVTAAFEGHGAQLG